MKKIFAPLAWLLSWLYWWLGDLSYRIKCRFDNSEGWVRFWYHWYNRNMIMSNNLQDWAGGAGKLWPWGPLLRDPKANTKPQDEL